LCWSLRRSRSRSISAHATPKNYSASAQIPERVTWKSKDGKEVSGLLYTPHNAKAAAKLPAVLWIHGGPEGQDVFRPDGWAQYLAQAGYVVLEPNYRGSTGCGEVFRNLNVEDSNIGEVDDVAAGAQYLITRGLADSAQLAIGGGSHGGTMTAYMVVHYPICLPQPSNCMALLIGSFLSSGRIHRRLFAGS
jgi:dipeptidyl aminopeptidase/acylaminoacyl peptidase